VNANNDTNKYEATKPNIKPSKYILALSFAIFIYILSSSGGKMSNNFFSSSSDMETVEYVANNIPKPTIPDV
jgi:hypothetical protein